ncbi:MAG: hypothetical protein N3E48_01865 [Candidatus Bathyarchaeota archaeon]|nr:hypothetical protein [Candidatus Bathyarchaeota archaeon]
MKKLLLLVARAVFYVYGFLWLLKPKKVSSLEDVLKLFYINFLRVKITDVEVVKIDKNELITRCKNPCPILTLTLYLKLDTKYACKVVSEPVCRYVLKRLNPALGFERNYNHIRPCKEGCEERIFWVR